jgi:hypothetical protein
VNPNIPKVFTANKYRIVNEWDLPIYDKTLQEKGYNENSAIYHVYINNLHKPYSHVGFFQYDMVFNKNILDDVSSAIMQTPDPVYFALMLETFHFCSNVYWFNPNMIPNVIKDYESFFSEKFNYNTLYPLLNTYILPVKTYEKVMSWVSPLIYKIHEETMKNYNMQTVRCSMSIFYERIIAFAIGQEKISSILIRDVEHKTAYRHNNKTCTFDKPLQRY